MLRASFSSERGLESEPKVYLLHPRFRQSQETGKLWALCVDSEHRESRYVVRWLGKDIDGFFVNLDISRPRKRQTPNASMTNQDILGRQEEPAKANDESWEDVIYDISRVLTLTLTFCVVLDALL